MIDVEYRNQHGELVGVETYTGFGYRKADRQPNGGERVTASTSSLDAVHVGDELPPLTYDVTATTVVLGALGGRDWRPMHHDHDFAVERNGIRDIFLNTTEPGGVVRALRHRLDRADRAARPDAASACSSSVFPGDTMVITGTVTKVETDDTGCGWVELDFALNVGDDARATGSRPRRHPHHSRRQPLGPPRRALAALNCEDVRWISTSPPSRRCSAKRSPACARATRASTWCAAMEDDPVGLPRQVLGAARRARPARDDAARAATAAAG